MRQRMHIRLWTAILAGLLATAAEGDDMHFVDVAAAAGLGVANVSGKDQRYIVEGMMGGGAFFDYDNDGDVDLFVGNGSSFEPFAPGGHPSNTLYRNEGDGTFSDVTQEAGLIDSSWSMGVAAADYDNDGDTDLFVSNYGPDRLYRNEGDSTFAEVAAAAGLGDEGWGTGATFGDYDNDGDVDLYVARYVDFSLDYESPIPCLWKNIGVYCGPVGLLPASDLLYRNEGDGTFIEVTTEAGMGEARLYGMSAIFSDYDGDGLPDLFVANDSTPNLLYRNEGNGTFSEQALLSGVAYSGEGERQGCMGAAVTDYDGDGLPDIFVTNFADEYNTLYRNEGGGFFADVAFASGVGAADRRLVAWGTGFFDADNDGDRDLFVANGHTYPEADLPEVDSSYEEANSLFENFGAGRFREVTEAAGPGLALRRVSRGAAFGDYDGDGDLDIFVLNLNDTPTLLRNETEAGAHLLVDLEGGASNRDGIGAKLKLTVGGKAQYAEVQSGGSYLAHNDMRVHFGMGAAERADELEIRWPSGRVQVLRDVESGQVLQVREPE